MWKMPKTPGMLPKVQAGMPRRSAVDLPSRRERSGTQHFVTRQLQSGPISSGV